MDEQPDSSQQLMDILLVMDEKGTLQAVSGVKDGELQTRNPLEDNNDLLRVDRQGDMFSNFFSNLWNQLKDPTRFHFFRVPEEEVQRVAADFQQRESQSVKVGEPLITQYEVKPPEQEQQQTQAGQQQQQPGQDPQYKYQVEDMTDNKPVGGCRPNTGSFLREFCFLVFSCTFCFRWPCTAPHNPTSFLSKATRKKLLAFRFVVYLPPGK